MNPNSIAGQPFDLLTELARFGLEHGISLNDPKAIPEFLTFVANAVSRALSRPILLHGQRTEAMFQAMLVRLGRLFPDKGRRQWQRIPQRKIPSARLPCCSTRRYPVADRSQKCLHRRPHSAKTPVYDKELSRETRKLCPCYGGDN